LALECSAIEEEEEEKEKEEATRIIWAERELKSSATII